MHRLAAFLLHASKFNPLSGWRNAQLFLKLDFCSREQIFALTDLALGDCPDPLILFLEIGAARVSEQYFEPAVSPSKHEQPSARPWSWHRVQIDGLNGWLHRAWFSLI